MFRKPVQVAFAAWSISTVAWAQEPPKFASFSPVEQQRMTAMMPSLYDAIAIKAQGGDAVAQTAMGSLLITAGRTTEALVWLKKAADFGMAQAQALIGLALFSGVGGEQDAVKAMPWLRKAAEQGDPIGASVLATMLASSNVGPPNPIEAVKWARLAAQADCGWTSAFRVDGEAPDYCALARGLLAGLLIGGNGVPVDYVESYMWADIALRTLPKDKYASLIQLQEALADRLTADRLEEAKRRALDWTPTRTKAK